MTEPVTRTEMEANLRVVKAEAETVRAGLEGKLDRVLDAITGIGRDVAEFKADTKTAIGNLASEVKEDYKNTRGTINNFAIGSLAIALTVVLAISVLVWAAQGNMATQNAMEPWTQLIRCVRQAEGGPASRPNRPAASQLAGSDIPTASPNDRARVERVAPQNPDESADLGVHLRPRR